MTDENHLKEWEGYKQRLLLSPPEDIDSQFTWDEILAFRIRCIDGLITGETRDYQMLTPGKPYK